MWKRGKKRKRRNGKGDRKAVKRAVRRRNKGFKNSIGFALSIYLIDVDNENYVNVGVNK